METKKSEPSKLDVINLKDCLAAEYVSFHYIRNNVNPTTKSIFPDSIKMLLARFLGTPICDEWDPNSINISDNEKNKVIIYGDNNKCIKRWKSLTSPWGYTCYILSKKLVDFSYKWRVKILECEGDRFGSLIGIVPQKNIIDPYDESKVLITHRFDDYDRSDNKGLTKHGSDRDCKYGGYGYWPYSTDVMHGKSRTTYGEKHVYPNDIVEIDLNMEQQTLSFIVNGENLGIAFQNVAKEKYKLIVAFYNSDRVQLLHD